MKADALAGHLQIEIQPNHQVLHPPIGALRHACANHIDIVSAAPSTDVSYTVDSSHVYDEVLTFVDLYTLRNDS